MLRRKSVRMTAMHLAECVGISTGRLSKIENDHDAPTDEEREAIERVLSEAGA